MSISSSLRASARAAYRDLLRASTSTFAGDEPVLKAFRHKIRTEAVENSRQIDSKIYEEKIILAKEIAEVLRKNIVQAVQVPGTQSIGGQATWSIRLTKDTELGSNETIKSLQPGHPSPNSTQNPGSDAAPHNTPSIPRYYSALKKAHKQRKVPELKEEDLEEKFVRGSGPGGQSINKTSNNVQLLHKPTGIRVTCQETRSLETNRMLARRRLLQRLDQEVNPGLSKEEMKRAKQIERERRRRKKAKKRAREKAVSPGDTESLLS